MLRATIVCIAMMKIILQTRELNLEKSRNLLKVSQVKQYEPVSHLTTLGFLTPVSEILTYGLEVDAKMLSSPSQHYAQYQPRALLPELKGLSVMATRTDLQC